MGRSRLRLCIFGGRILSLRWDADSKYTNKPHTPAFSTLEFLARLLWFLFRKSWLMASWCTCVCCLKSPYQNKTSYTRQETHTFLGKKRIRWYFLGTCVWLSIYSSTSNPSSPTNSSMGNGWSSGIWKRPLAVLVCTCRSIGRSICHCLEAQSLSPQPSSY